MSIISLKLFSICHLKKTYSDFETNSSFDRPRCMWGTVVGGGCEVCEGLWWVVSCMMQAGHVSLREYNYPSLNSIRVYINLSIILIFPSKQNT